MRHLSDYCALVRENLGQFTFEEQRLALRALGFKLYVNGNEPDLWRYEVSIPLKPFDNVIALHVAARGYLCGTSLARGLTTAG